MRRQREKVATTLQIHLSPADSDPMIVKAPDSDRPADPPNAAGLSAEQAMACHLRRAFKTDPDVFVFNDLRLVFDGEVAQIDHLVLHRGGMVLIESKSVSGEVLVNERGEWVRRADSDDKGMPSPVLRARRQEALLRAMLRVNSERLRDRLRLGTMQARFGRDWPIDILIVASDECRITREVDVPELCRADQATGAIDAIVDRHKRGRRSLNVLNDDGIQWLSPAEMGRLVQCLSSSHTPRSQALESAPDSQPSAPPVVASPAPVVALEAAAPVAPAPLAAGAYADEPPPFCRHCGSLEVHMRYARITRPYHFRCDRCDGITPAQWECGACGALARIRKRGPDFFRVCETCGTTAHIFTNPQVARPG